MKKLYISLIMSLLCVFASQAQESVTALFENPLTKKGVKLDVDLQLGYGGSYDFESSEPSYYKLKGTLGGVFSAAAIYQTKDVVNFGIGCGIVSLEFNETRGDAKEKDRRHSFGVPVFARLGVVDKLWNVHGFINLDPGIMIGTHQMKTSFYGAAQIGVMVESMKIGLSLQYAKPDYKLDETYRQYSTFQDYCLSIGVNFGVRFAL